MPAKDIESPKRCRLPFNLFIMISSHRQHQWTDYPVPVESRSGLVAVWRQLGMGSALLTRYRAGRIGSWNTTRSLITTTPLGDHPAETPYTVKLIDLLEYDEFTNKSTFISCGKDHVVVVQPVHICGRSSQRDAKCLLLQFTHCGLMNLYSRRRRRLLMVPLTAKVIMRAQSRTTKSHLSNLIRIHSSFTSFSRQPTTVHKIGP